MTARKPFAPSNVIDVETWNVGPPWDCPLCTFLNDGGVGDCEMCGTANPHLGAFPAPPSHSPRAAPSHSPNTTVPPSYAHVLIKEEAPTDRAPAAVPVAPARVYLAPVATRTSETRATVANAPATTTTTSSTITTIPNRGASAPAINSSVASSFHVASSPSGRMPLAHLGARPTGFIRLPSPETCDRDSDPPDKGQRSQVMWPDPADDQGHEQAASQAATAVFGTGASQNSASDDCPWLHEDPFGSLPGSGEPRTARLASPTALAPMAAGTAALAPLTGTNTLAALDGTSTTPDVRSRHPSNASTVASTIAPYGSADSQVSQYLVSVDVPHEATEPAYDVRVDVSPSSAATPPGTPLRSVAKKGGWGPRRTASAVDSRDERDASWTPPKRKRVPKRPRVATERALPRPVRPMPDILIHDSAYQGHIENPDTALETLHTIRDIHSRTGRYPSEALTRLVVEVMREAVNPRVATLAAQVLREMVRALPPGLLLPWGILVRPPPAPTLPRPGSHGRAVAAAAAAPPVDPVELFRMLLVDACAEEPRARLMRRGSDTDELNVLDAPARRLNGGMTLAVVEEILVRDLQFLPDSPLPLDIKDLVNSTPCVEALVDHTLGCCRAASTPGANAALRSLQAVLGHVLAGMQRMDFAKYHQLVPALVTELALQTSAARLSFVRTLTLVDARADVAFGLLVSIAQPQDAPLPGAVLARASVEVAPSVFFAVVEVVRTLEPALREELLALSHQLVCALSAAAAPPAACDAHSRAACTLCATNALAEVVSWLVQGWREQAGHGLSARERVLLALLDKFAAPGHPLDDV